MTKEGWLNKLAGHNTGRKQPRTNARATVSCSNNSAMGIGDGFTKSGVAYTTYRMGTADMGKLAEGIRHPMWPQINKRKEKLEEHKAAYSTCCLGHILPGWHMGNKGLWTTRSQTTATQSSTCFSSRDKGTDCNAPPQQIVPAPAPRIETRTKTKLATHPRAETRSKQRRPPKQLLQRPSLKMAATYSPAGMQYHRRDRA